MEARPHSSTKSRFAGRTPYKEEGVSFGIKDARGRVIGALISTCETDFVTLPETACGWYNIAPGHYFELHVHCTRNGCVYGAMPPYRYFTTEAERDAAIQKYLKDAKARAAKK